MSGVSRLFFFVVLVACTFCLACVALGKKSFEMLWHATCALKKYAIYAFFCYATSISKKVHATFSQKKTCT